VISVTVLLTDISFCGATCYRKEYIFGAGFEVLSPVVMESYIFWNITPCILLKDNRRFCEHLASFFREA
jgi:hypothetical protein